MANPELVKALDYILNRCDDSSLDVLAEAVVRRRRDLALFGGVVDMPSPQNIAKEISSGINAGVSAGMEGLKKSVKDMAARIIKQEAPDIPDEHLEELVRSWIPDVEPGAAVSSSNVPRDMLISMIDQFVRFSNGEMNKAEDKKLRDEIGTWPERYWKIFPSIIRSIISDFLKGKISESEYSSKINIALKV